LVLFVFNFGIAVHFICKILCSSIPANCHTRAFLHKKFSEFTLNKPSSSVSGKYVFVADAILVFYTAQNIYTNRFGALTLFSSVILDSVSVEENFIGNKIFMLYFFLGDSPATEFYMPIFREHSVCPIFIPIRL